MKSKSIFTNHVRYLIFSEIYLRYSEPKTRRKAFAILEGAISTFERRGFENVTFLMIAREAGLTPPSLRHYFANLDEIRDMSLRYIHLTAQRIIVDSMEKTTDPIKMFQHYIDAHSTWALNFKAHIRVWLNFLSLSSRRKKDRQLNTEAVENGTRRIMQMLTDGRNAGAFHHAANREEEIARLIQILLLGWLTTLVTEEPAHPEVWVSHIRKLCLDLVRA